MKSARMILAAALVLAVAVASTWAPRADAQGQTIKIGVLYDHSGPFSAAGSLNCWRGAKMIIDYVNEKGGVLGKYKIVQVDGDGQSKAEVAINEAERLLNVEKVDVLAGIYSSAYVAHYAQDKLKKPAKDVRAGIIYEDGPYGAGVAAANEAEAKKQGMQVVLKEGYSIQAPDLSSLVTKLRSQRPDVLFHTGYNPDIALFLRQAKEQGLRVKVYVGHGAGHSQLAKLKETFGNEVEGFHTVDPPASQLIDPKRLKPGLGDLTQEMLRRYKAFEPTIPPGQVAPHVSMGFNNMWVLLNDVLPRAIGKHGGFGPEALAKAARETDIPEGGTMQGYGVKFHPVEHAMAGQNMRAIAAVYQVVDGELKHVYPPVIASLGSPPVVLPASSPWAAR